jgi:pyruvate,water dikinase
MRVLTGQVVDLRLRWIERQANQARHTLRLREQTKSALLTLGGEERRIVREMGQRLATSGLIDAPRMIELLGDREAEQMLLGAPGPPEADLAWRTTAGRRAVAAPALPELFCGAPEVEASTGGEDWPPLSGWAASPGRVRGPARIIDDIAAGAALEPGEVLVAVATDPSWTPVIAEAAGIVLEVGGPLSHAAIVARELGIPAVLKVNGATKAIDQGAVVEVDGFAGTVRVVDGAEVAP